MDIRNIEEELIAAEKYEKAVCHMRTRVRICLESIPQNTEARSSSSVVDPEKDSHHVLTHYLQPISPRAGELRPTLLRT